MIKNDFFLAKLLTLFLSLFNHRPRRRKNSKRQTANGQQASANGTSSLNGSSMGSMGTIKATNALNNMRNASANGLGTISINANGQMNYNDQTSNMLLYSNGIKSASGNFHYSHNFNDY